jgi:four helix bundle protein
MRDFREIKVWEKAHRLTLAVYKITKAFPREELYGMLAQIRRSSASIPANIAEACGRATNAEFAHFLQIAMGSATELEYHLLLAHDLSFISDLEYTSLAEDVSEVKRMLTAFIQTLRSLKVEN